MRKFCRSDLTGHFDYKRCFVEFLETTTILAFKEVTKHLAIRIALALVFYIIILSRLVSKLLNNYH